MKALRRCQLVLICLILGGGLGLGPVGSQWSLVAKCIFTLNVGHLIYI